MLTETDNSYRSIDSLLLSAISQPFPSEFHHHLLLSRKADTSSTISLSFVVCQLCSIGTFCCVQRLFHYGITTTTTFLSALFHIILLPPSCIVLLQESLPSFYDQSQQFFEERERRQHSSPPISFLILPTQSVRTHTSFTFILVSLYLEVFSCKELNTPGVGFVVVVIAKDSYCSEYKKATTVGALFHSTSFQETRNIASKRSLELEPFLSRRLPLRGR